MLFVTDPSVTSNFVVAPQSSVQVPPLHRSPGEKIWVTSWKVPHESWAFGFRYMTNELTLVESVGRVNRTFTTPSPAITMSFSEGTGSEFDLCATPTF